MMEGAPKKQYDSNASFFYMIMSHEVTEGEQSTETSHSIMLGSQTKHTHKEHKHGSRRNLARCSEGLLRFHALPLIPPMKAFVPR